MPSPKSGSPGSAVAPADPKQALEADKADPGEMAKVKERELLIRTATDAANGVIAEVRDTGPGLQPDGVEHDLFDAFYTTKSGGMGMGLTICRSIIEAHGGRISATANAPRGAVFRFTLPAQPDTASC